MGYAVVGRDAFCKQFSLFFESPRSLVTASPLSSELTVHSPSPAEEHPGTCLSTASRNPSVGMRRRSRGGGNLARMVCNGTTPSPPFSNSNNVEVSLPTSTLRIPWDDCLDSFSVDVIGAEAIALNVPLLAPFTIATTKLDKVQNVAISVVLSDGSVGWGEAPTLPPVTAEDQAVALAKAAQACEFLKVQPGQSLREILQQMARILPGHDFASMSG